nr:uncharacterized protein LOC127307818 isoform X1 [Lolium perenne]
MPRAFHGGTRIQTSSLFPNQCRHHRHRLRFWPSPPLISVINHQVGPLSLSLLCRLPAAALTFCRRAAANPTQARFADIAVVGVTSRSSCDYQHAHLCSLYSCFCSWSATSTPWPRVHVPAGRSGSSVSPSKDLGPIRSLLLRFRWLLFGYYLGRRYRAMKAICRLGHSATAVMVTTHLQLRPCLDRCNGRSDQTYTLLRLGYDQVF